MTATGDVEQPPSVDVYAAVLGTESDATELLDELVGRVGSDPISASHAHMSFPETRRFWAQLGAAEHGAADGPEPEVTEPRHLFAKSEFFRRPLPTDAIAALVATFSEGRARRASRASSTSCPGVARTTACGPTPPPSSIATELFQLKHAAVVDPPATADRDRRLLTGGSPDRGPRCIRGDRGGCSRTSPIRISRIGPRPTTAPTTTAWFASRHAMTQGTSSASVSPSPPGRSCPHEPRGGRRSTREGCQGLDALLTQPLGINDRGDIVGAYIEAVPGPDPYGYHETGRLRGFVMREGRFMPIDFPG